MRDFFTTMADSLIGPLNIPASIKCIFLKSYHYRQARLGLVMARNHGVQARIESCQHCDSWHLIYRRNK